MVSNGEEEDFLLDEPSVLAFLADYEMVNDVATQSAISTIFTPTQCCTLAASDSGSSGSSPEEQPTENKKSWRQRRKEEVLNLREVVKQLSAELERLKMAAGVHSTLPDTNQPRIIAKLRAVNQTEASLVWERIAGRQSMLRQSSEEENAKLREAVTHHLQQAKSLQRAIKRKLREDLVSSSMNLIRKNRLNTRGVTPPLDSKQVFDKLMVGMDGVYQDVDNFFQQAGMHQLPCPGRRNETARNRTSRGVFVEFLDNYALPFDLQQTAKVIWSSAEKRSEEDNFYFFQQFTAGSNTRMRSFCYAFSIDGIDFRVIQRSLTRKYVENGRTVFITRTLIQPIYEELSISLVETSRMILKCGELSTVGPSTVMQTHREAILLGDLSGFDAKKYPSLDSGIETWESSITRYNNKVEDRLIQANHNHGKRPLWCTYWVNKLVACPVAGLLYGPRSGVVPNMYMPFLSSRVAREANLFIRLLDVAVVPLVVVNQHRTGAMREPKSSGMWIDDRLQEPRDMTPPDHLNQLHPLIMRVFALPLAVFAFLAMGASAFDACTGPNARTQPPAGAIVVDATGLYAGSFRNISEAVAHIPNTTEQHTLFLFPGVYSEQVLISKLKGPLVLQGYTCDTASYTANQVTITQSKAQRDIPPEITSGRNDQTGTLRLKTNNVRAYNLNVANTAGRFQRDGQAVAAIIEGNNYGFYGCNFTGYQDTVYANKGRELFAKSYISGAVDFIFGSKAQAWFESCDIETVGEGAITANGRVDESSPSYYVFNNARVFGNSGNGSSYLGRPWHPYARVVFQNSELSDVINPEGWQLWNNDNNTANVYFKEFNNRGPGAATDKRVPFSGQLTAAVEITELFGGNYTNEWFVDTAFL